MARGEAGPREGGGGARGSCGGGWGRAIRGAYGRGGLPYGEGYGGAGTLEGFFRIRTARRTRTATAIPTPKTRTTTGQGDGAGATSRVRLTETFTGPYGWAPEKSTLSTITVSAPAVRESAMNTPEITVCASTASSQ